MVDFFSARTEVIGLFVSGSIAAATTDEYSDIDFRVVVERESFEDFIKGHMSYPYAWGDLICNNGGHNVSVSHFRPFNKVDIFYYAPEHLKPSPWYNLPIKILFDPLSIIRNLIESSKSLTFAPTSAEVSISISIGIGNLHEVYRRAQRNELVYAQAILNSLRESIIEAEDALNDRALQGRFGCSHFEQRCPSEVQHVIMASYTVAEKKQILASLKDLLHLYRKQIEALHGKYSLDRDVQNDFYAIDAVLSDIEIYHRMSGYMVRGNHELRR